MTMEMPSPSTSSSILSEDHAVDVKPVSSKSLSTSAKGGRSSGEDDKNQNGADPMELKDGKDEVFSWKKFLLANPHHNMKHVPVYEFPRAPLSEQWDQFEAPDLKVEFQVDGNCETDVAKYDKVFWVGTIRKYFGYMVKVEEEGYPDSYAPMPYQWLNFLTDCYRVGYVADLRGAVLIPPSEIFKSAKDWRDTILNRLAGQLTVHKLVAETFASAKSCGFKVGAGVEVLDFTNTSKMKEGIVADIRGTRIFVRYWDGRGEAYAPTSGIWVDVFSSWVVPPGWSQSVGHELSAHYGYEPKELGEDFFDQGEEDEAIDIQVGMKLEAISPSNPNYISASTVVKVLKFGFMMISSDSSLDIYTEQEFVSTVKVSNKSYCCHVSSPNIFPCGYSKELGIELEPPQGCDPATFVWDEYFKTTGCKGLAITRCLKPQGLGFSIDSKLEAVDLLNPSTIRLATVGDVKGSLLRIHFDGCGRKKDQWMNFESFDLYPVGWCDTFQWESFLGPKKESNFWKTYKHPNSLPPTREITRSRGRLVSQMSQAKQKGLKRKASDRLESINFNSDVYKADVIKLGSKPIILRKSTMADLRNTLKKRTTTTLEGIAVNSSLDRI